MQDKKRVLENIDKIHTTEMGIDRIKKNLKLNLHEKKEIVNYCKKKITDVKSNIYKKGKNYYCELEDIRITINSHSYTIITAHQVKEVYKKKNTKTNLF